MIQANTNAAAASHQRLQRLVGRWRTQGRTLGPPALEFHGIDSYRWVGSGWFLLHEIAAVVDGEPVVAVATIWYDRELDAYRSHHVDAAGASSYYEVSLDGDSWSLRGARKRYSGRFSADGQTLSGTWERREEYGPWQAWMEISSTRLGPDQ